MLLPLNGQKTELISRYGGTGDPDKFLLPSNPRFHIQATLCNNQLSLLLSALIGPGAEHNFLDQKLPAESGITLEPQQKPLTAKALDRRFLALITHHTVSITPRISGNKHESIRCNVIFAPRILLVLGYPWLKLLNPHNDWSAGSIVV